MGLTAVANRGAKTTCACSRGIAALQSPFSRASFVGSELGCLCRNDLAEEAGERGEEESFGEIHVLDTSSGRQKFF